MSEDLRQFVNMPQREGFPNPVAKNTILRANYTQTVCDDFYATADFFAQGAFYNI
jgi:hypothetical protein